MPNAASSPTTTTPAPSPANWHRRAIRLVLLFLVTPYVAVTIIMVCVQRQLIFAPTRTSRLLAREAGAGVEDVEIPAADDLTLHGWRFRARLPAGTDAANFLVLYFPGNAGCREDRIPDCQDFTRLGCDVLLFDYRGYGDNGGSPSEEHFAADARQIWMFATQELQYPPERLILFGESLGGAVATRLAAELSLAGDPPAALVLNSTFASMPRTVAWHFPAFPFQFLIWDRFPSIERIPQVASAVLQFHGTADETVPFEHGRALFDAAPSASRSGVEKRFVTIEGGGHNSITVDQMDAEIGALVRGLSER